MAFFHNRVQLAGNLTRDPEFRQTSRSPVAKFTLAINRRWKQGDEVRDEATFLDCECWGRTAELVQQYLGKGSPAFVEGRLKQDSWEDKDGNKRHRVLVVAESVQFLPTSQGTRRVAEGGGDDDRSEAVGVGTRSAETDLLADEAPF